MQTSETAISSPLTEQVLLPFLISYYLESGQAITLWRMPNSAEKHLLICSNGIRQLDEVSLEESETGFIFAPYNRNQKKLFFRSDLIYTFKDGYLLSGDLTDEKLRFLVRKNAGLNNPSKKYPSRPLPVQPMEGSYLAIVQKAVDMIREGFLEKVVPSRSRKFNLPEGLDLWNTFDRLCQANPNCMTSLVSSEETGTWMGSTPELLVSVDDQSHFKTVALAGTKRHEPGTDLKGVAWTEKEIEEQAMVSRYIISCFKKIRLREYDEHGPRTAVAGSLLHLKTEYDVDMVATNFPQLGSIMLRLLHPTSAVCGMPLEPALEFLKKHEGYDRQFYSGYLGPVNFRKESHIFVNLRCMQVGSKHAILYAGAGVTIDSRPEKELAETELKFETLLSMLR